jgi:hypothetical protein
MRDVILALNAGSSSIKFALLSVTPGAQGAQDVAAVAPLYRGEFADIGSTPTFRVRDAEGQPLHDGPADSAAVSLVAPAPVVLTSAAA